MNDIVLNDKPAVKIFAERLVKWQPSSKYDCEGTVMWLRNDYTEYNEKEKTLIIEEWYYNGRFKDGY